MKSLEASEGKHISPDCSEVGLGAGSWTGAPVVLDWGHSRQNPALLEPPFPWVEVTPSKAVLEQRGRPGLDGALLVLARVPGSQLQHLSTGGVPRVTHWLFPTPRKVLLYVLD